MLLERIEFAMKYGNKILVEKDSMRIYLKMGSQLNT